MPKRYPGIYVEEISALKPIEGVSTTTTAFIGFAPAGKVGAPVEVSSWQDFCDEFVPGRRRLPSLPVHMPDAVRGYFENGGKKAVILRLDEAYAAPDQYVQGVAKLDSVSDSGMVVTPETQDEHVIQAVLAHMTERKQAVYVFDAPPGMEPTELRGFAGRFDSDYGALYYPWLQLGGRAIPSAGHAAGVIVRTHLQRGVYKAPAGTDAATLGITGTSITVTANELDRLREARVNWIGSSRGSPIALQGARTLGENYLSVQRALIYLERSLTRGLEQLTFKISEPATWAKVTSLAENFLQSEYVKGGLLGNEPSEAYFVECDATTNPPSDVEQGRLRLLAGVALIRPAEFFLVRIGIQTHAPNTQ